MPVLPNFTYITRSKTLNKLVEHLLDQPVIAVDTESDSLYSYFEKVCLLQITAAGKDYIIDPLEVDLSPLAPVFASESVEKIFHAAEYDILSLKRDYGFEFSALFDTMITARILGWAKYGLGNLLSIYFQVKPDKKFQQYNWGKRPLSEQALQYACMDTRYLSQLREIQIQKLISQNRLEEARAAFRRMTCVRSAAKVFEPSDFLRIKGAKLLSTEQQALLQALFSLRDYLARKLDRPPFKVLNDSVLLKLAEECPESLMDLRRFKGVNQFLIKQFGNKFLSVLNATYSTPHLQGRKYANNDLTEMDVVRYEHLRNWRNTLAEDRGVEPGVILSNNDLKAVAKSNPETVAELKTQHVLGEWQCETYGQTLIDELRNHSS